MGCIQIIIMSNIKKKIKLKTENNGILSWKRMIQLQNAKIPKLFGRREKTLCSVRLHYVKQDTNISRVSTEREYCV